MKKLFLFFFLIPLFSTAQNWHTVPLGQHNIYRVSVSGADSNWDGYLRNIHVDNIVSGFAGDEFNFYKTLRKDQSEILDTTNGPTWLGHSSFRFNNGAEIFLNKYLDTIRINTLGQVNDNWIISYDTTNSIRFEGTISSLDTMYIDGQIDSIKRIDIQAYNGLTPVSSIYNTYQLVLSKNHGFYKTLDFYGFPNYVGANRSSGVGLNPLSHDVYPILPYEHIRLDSSVTTRAWHYNDLAWQYQAGNEWIVDHTNHPTYQYVTYDSIISSTFIGNDTAIVTLRRDTLYHKYFPPAGGNGPYYQLTYSSNVIQDTVIAQPISFFTLDSMENRVLPSSNAHDYYAWQFLDYYCQDKIVLFDTSSHRTPVSTNSWAASESFEGLNLYNTNWITTLGSQSSSGFTHIDYMKINGCEVGTFYSLKPSANGNYNKQNNLFKIYPNPTLSSFHIDSDVDWQKVEIISLQGKIVKSFNFDQQHAMDIASLTNGLYILKVATKTGNYIYKILKE